MWRRSKARVLRLTTSRMLRDLLATEGVKVGRLHVSTLIKKMAIEAIYRRPNTSTARARSGPLGKGDDPVDHNAARRRGVEAVSEARMARTGAREEAVDLPVAGRTGAGRAVDS